MLVSKANLGTEGAGGRKGKNKKHHRGEFSRGNKLGKKGRASERKKRKYDRRQKKRGSMKK